MYSISKKIIYLIFSPITISLLIVFTASIIFLNTAGFKFNSYLLILGFFPLFLFWLPWLPDLLLGFLEHKYNSFSINSYDKELLKEIKHIVVLAGGYTINPQISSISQFSYHGLVRLIDGIRLYRKIPGSKLILSGGFSKNEPSAAELMATVALELGVPKDAILLEAKSRSTFEEVLYLLNIIKKDKFLLVTSANHMPRSMALFLKIGMNPVPAPTGHCVKEPQKISTEIPTALNLMKTELAVREYIKLLKEKLLNRI